MIRNLNRRDAFIVAGAGALAAAGSARAQTPDGLIQVTLHTDQGDIVLALESKKAPITTDNFLRYVDNKRYDGGTIYRAMRSEQTKDWGLIQGGSDKKKPRYPGIPHESTAMTGLTNRAGVISLARGAPGTGTSDFFISVGDMSGLDAHPDQPGDNAGFAAFGHVISGMDVVLKIQAMPTKADAEVEAMKGQMLESPVNILTARRVTT